MVGSRFDRPNHRSAAPSVILLALQSVRWKISPSSRAKICGRVCSWVGMAIPDFRLRVNGHVRSIPGGSERSLLAVLRDELGLTGTKYGCGEGQCGSCTVLVDGAPVRSCQIPVGEIGEREVTTVEGLAIDGILNPVQAAFAELGAFQCGFCIPGMIVSATALLRNNPSPSEIEIRTALEGNLCRCCGYARILRAVERASERAREGSSHL